MGETALGAEAEDGLDEAGRLGFVGEEVFVVRFGESQRWGGERGHCRVKP